MNMFWVFVLVLMQGRKALRFMCGKTYRRLEVLKFVWGKTYGRLEVLNLKSLGDKDIGFVTK